MGRRAIALAASLAVALAALLAPRVLMAAPARALVVIVHPRSKIASLSRAQLRRLFLKTTRRWPDGQAVMPINAKANSLARKLFDQLALGLSAHESALYWIRQRVRGHGVAPRSLHSARLIQRIVSHQREAVGYVLASQLSRSIKVKVLRIDGMTPDHHNYPLRSGRAR